MSESVISFVSSPEGSAKRGGDLTESDVNNLMDVRAGVAGGGGKGNDRGTADTVNAAQIHKGAAQLGNPTRGAPLVRKITRILGASCRGHAPFPRAKVTARLYGGMSLVWTKRRRFTMLKGLRKGGKDGGLHD